MVRGFEVVAQRPTRWPGMAGPAQVVTQFLSHVRMTGDPAAARRLMHATVKCHQVVSEQSETILRSPEDYAAHVRDMREAFGAFVFQVDELLTEGDLVYVRWRQQGRDLRNEDGTPGTGGPLGEVGSAVYRVEANRIAEYWVQLDRLGLAVQLERLRRDRATPGVHQGASTREEAP